jgi:hypothetical protein
MDNHLSAAIVEFLNSQSAVKATRPRCNCGTLMVFQTCTFFFNEQSWPMQLPFCPECDPISPVPIYCAWLV